MQLYLSVAPPGWVSTEGRVPRRVGLGQGVDPVPLLRHVVHQVHSEAVLLKDNSEVPTPECNNKEVLFSTVENFNS